MNKYIILLIASILLSCGGPKKIQSSSDTKKKTKGNPSKNKADRKKYSNY